MRRGARASGDKSACVRSCRAQTDSALTTVSRCAKHSSRAPHALSTRGRTAIHSEGGKEVCGWRWPCCALCRLRGSGSVPACCSGQASESAALGRVCCPLQSLLPSAEPAALCRVCCPCAACVHLGCCPLQSLLPLRSVCAFGAVHVSLSGALSLTFSPGTRSARARRACVHRPRVRSSPRPHASRSRRSSPQRLAPAASRGGASPLR